MNRTDPELFPIFYVAKGPQEASCRCLHIQARLGTSKNGIERRRWVDAGGRRRRWLSEMRYAEVPARRTV